MKIKIPFKTPTIKCIICKEIIKNKKCRLTCGNIECRMERKKEWNVNYKKRDYVREKGKTQSKDWRLNNPKKYKKNYELQNNKTSTKVKNKKRYQEQKNNEDFKERKRINQRNYCKQERVKKMYKEYMKEYGRIYTKKKRAEDEYVRRVERLRDRFRKAIRKVLNGKNLRSSSSYGINFHKIAQHLGSCPGKKEDYHIDHIKPLCIFDLTKDLEIKKAFAPENHQWLTAKENMKKGGRR